jgi:hypothetical protein
MLLGFELYRLGFGRQYGQGLTIDGLNGACVAPICTENPVNIADRQNLTNSRQNHSTFGCLHARNESMCQPAINRHVTSDSAVDRLECFWIGVERINVF